MSNRPRVSETYLEAETLRPRQEAKPEDNRQWARRQSVRVSLAEMGEAAPRSPPLAARPWMSQDIVCSHACHCQRWTLSRQTLSTFPWQRGAALDRVFSSVSVWFGDDGQDFWRRLRRRMAVARLGRFGLRQHLNLPSSHRHGLSLFGGVCPNVGDRAALSRFSWRMKWL